MSKLFYFSNNQCRKTTHSSMLMRIGDLKEISANSGYLLSVFPQDKASDFFCFKNSFFSVTIVCSNSLSYKVVVKLKLFLNGFRVYTFPKRLYFLWKQDWTCSVKFVICQDSLSENIHYLIILKIIKLLSMV